MSRWPRCFAVSRRTSQSWVILRIFSCPASHPSRTAELSWLWIAGGKTVTKLVTPDEKQASRLTPFPSSPYHSRPPIVPSLQPPLANHSALEIQRALSLIQARLLCKAQRLTAGRPRPRPPPGAALQARLLHHRLQELPQGRRLLHRRRLPAGSPRPGALAPWALNSPKLSKSP